MAKEDIQTACIRVILSVNADELHKAILREQFVVIPVLKNFPVFNGS
jgi:hypothetical protein